MQSTLIITAPHQLCKPSKNRVCDTAAGTATQEIVEILKLNNSFNSIVLFGDEHRHDHDLNRKISRHTPFRKKLDDIFNTSSNPKNNLNTLILDIHSFPNEYLDEAGDINFFKKGEKAPDIVFLQGPLDIFFDKSLCNTLYISLQRYFTCKIIKNIHVLDILNNANDHQIPGVLLEFNEKFNYDKNALNFMCSIILNTIHRMKLRH
jgi:hypothetical protein